MHGIAFLNGLLSNSILPRLSQPCKKATANPLLFLETRDYCPRLFLCCLRKLDVAFRKLHISDFFKQDLIVDN